MLGLWQAHRHRRDRCLRSLADRHATLLSAALAVRAARNSRHARVEVPDVYIWVKGESTKAVVVLRVLRLAIAVVTYNALAHLAAIRRRAPAAG
jgi:hypothetical protein